MSVSLVMGPDGPRLLDQSGEAALQVATEEIAIRTRRLRSGHERCDQRRREPDERVPRPLAQAESLGRNVKDTELMQ